MIKYELPGEAHITISIYNIQGQVVAKLLDEQQAAGNHSVQWSASNLPSGMYFCRMAAGEFSSIRKLMLLK